MWYVSISSLFLSLSSSSRGGDVVIDGGKSSFASLLRFDRADLTTTRVRRKRAELLLALMPFERAKGARAAKEIVVIVLILLSTNTLICIRVSICLRVCVFKSEGQF